MNKKFGDSGLSIHFIQQLLNETYNSTVHVNGEYYKTFDMNYGLAHFLAKYLDRTYPVLDSATKEDYANIPDGGEVRPIDKPISIMNYFLCDNKGNRLHFNDTIYNTIYNEYMRVPDGGQPLYDGKYMIKTDLPLFTNYDTETHMYSIDDNTIFNMVSTRKQKDICEIDDLVATFLLGRVITPWSSREEIYYVQKLLLGEDNISSKEKGNWNYVRPDGMTLTDIIINFQRQCVNVHSDIPLIVTGYFDIFTEKAALSLQNSGGGISVTGL